MFDHRAAAARDGARSRRGWRRGRRRRPPANQLSAAEKKAGWVLLFDGKTLDGWRAYKRPDAAGTRWVVKDGLLRLKPGDSKDTDGAARHRLGGDLRPVRAGLGLAHLAGRQQRPEVLRARRSRRGDRPRVSAHRRRAASRREGGPAAPDRGALRRAARRRTARSSRPASGTQSRVVVKGNDVEHWLNGTKVLPYELASPALKTAVAKSKFKDVERFGKPQKAHILLQDHGDAVCYRNVKVRALNGKS